MKQSESVEILTVWNRATFVYKVFGIFRERKLRENLEREKYLGMKIISSWALFIGSTHTREFPVFQENIFIS